MFTKETSFDTVLVTDSKDRVHKFESANGLWFEADNFTVRVYIARERSEGEGMGYTQAVKQIAHFIGRELFVKGENKS